MKKQLLSFLFLFVIAISLCRAQTSTLWGLTAAGGTNYAGTIFNYNTSTNIESVVHDFGSDTDGKGPLWSLVQASNGLLYGMTTSGGGNGGGIIFSYNISNSSYTNLYDFGNYSHQSGSLIQGSNGLLYGTTTSGGVYGDGTILSYDILTGSETDLHDFANSDTDGFFPYSSLIQVNDSMLFGSTEDGGSHSGGTIFSYNILTKAEAILHSFGNGTDGVGTIFSYNIFTGNETDLHNFGSGTDGNQPPFYGSLIQVNDSLLFGATGSGGNYNNGTIFSYNISTKTETILHSFGNGTDGVYPSGNLILTNKSLLYGMTAFGGANDSGTIFSYNISTDTEIVIQNFTGNNGANPYGSLIEVDTPATGINQLSTPNNQLSIYPNPTSGQFTIKSTGNQNGYTVEVYNVMGEKIYVAPKSPSDFIGVYAGDFQNQTIDLSPQPTGLYFVYLKSEEGVEVGKVMVAK